MLHIFIANGTARLRCAFVSLFAIATKIGMLAP